MDGKTLLTMLDKLLEEDSNSTFMDDYASYWFLWEAAIDFAQRTKCLRTEQELTMVADQAGYVLNADYLGLYLLNGSYNYFVKYYDASNYSFPTWKPYEEIVYNNDTDSVTVPSHFTIIDYDTLYDQITGTTTSASASAGGSCTLTDTSGDFSEAAVGDVVHNTTDGSMGIILSKTSTTVVVTALFGGTNNDWTSGDSYVVQPQGRYQAVFNPPPSTADHTATIYYLQRPSPVFSDYGVYRFPQQYSAALVKYAAWLYKYRDKEPNYGDKWYIYYDNMVKRFSSQSDHVLHRKRYRVNLKVR